jgi:hypothetical protein
MSAKIASTHPALRQRKVDEFDGSEAGESILALKRVKEGFVVFVANPE